MADLSSEAQIIRNITIEASPATVWRFLTEPELMNRWMTERKMEVLTDWKTGSSIVIRIDWYAIQLENKGTIVAYEPERSLIYTHLSSISRLPDAEASYSVIAFRLRPADAATELTVAVSRFPTETIYHHLHFYWNTAPGLLKRVIEGQPAAI